ncbi:hypothetical protein BDZ85DRAFT_245861 [Elsinoe ampelina]|uniref:Uncharacterized protein n=1 Tax=Elsinoe ampelina TaxID=302913 RepID=A0A6A6GNF4_9PEZI|nr:hypothetical protein BDZ85DRAFT_245861 [Elsinoe ampelina]
MSMPDGGRIRVRSQHVKTGKKKRRSKRTAAVLEEVDSQTELQILQSSVSSPAGTTTEEAIRPSDDSITSGKRPRFVSPSSTLTIDQVTHSLIGTSNGDLLDGTESPVSVSDTNKNASDAGAPVVGVEGLELNGRRDKLQLIEDAENWTWKAARDLPTWDWKSPPNVDMKTNNPAVNAFRAKCLVGITTLFRRVTSVKDLRDLPEDQRLATFAYWALFGMTDPDFFFRLFIGSTPAGIQEKYGAEAFDRQWLARLYRDHSFWTDRTLVGPVAYKILGIRSESGEIDGLLDEFLSNIWMDGVEFSAHDGSTMPRNNGRQVTHEASIRLQKQTFRVYRWFDRNDAEARFVELCIPPVGIADGFLRLLEAFWTIIDHGFQNPERHEWSSPFRMKFIYDMVDEVRRTAGFPQVFWEGTNNAFQLSQGFNNELAKTIQPCQNSECPHDTHPKTAMPTGGAQRYLAHNGNPLGGYYCRNCYKHLSQGKPLPTRAEIDRTDHYGMVRDTKGHNAKCDNCGIQESLAYWDRNISRSHVLSKDNQYHLCTRCGSWYEHHKELPTQGEVALLAAQQSLRDNRDKGEYPICQRCEEQEPKGTKQKRWYVVQRHKDELKVLCYTCREHYRDHARRKPALNDDKTALERKKAEAKLDAAKRDPTGELLKPILCSVCYISFYFLLPAKMSIMLVGSEYRCVYCRDAEKSNKYSSASLAVHQAANLLRNAGADVHCDAGLVDGCIGVEEKMTRSNEPQVRKFAAKDDGLYCRACAASAGQRARRS